jgi:hypothetical protein
LSLSFERDSRRRSLKFTALIDVTNAHVMKYAPELVRESAARSSLRRLRVKKFSNIQSAWAQDMLQCDFSPSNSECLLLILTDFVFNSIFESATLKSRTELIRYKVPQRSCQFVELLT